MASTNVIKRETQSIGNKKSNTLQKYFSDGKTDLNWNK